jgi:hypothetical protein
MDVVRISMIRSFDMNGSKSGYKNFNYEAFNEISQILREAGYKVVNPAENGDGDQTRTWHEYMRDDIELIVDRVDALVVLQDWENSEGAKVEVAVARALGLPVWDVSQFAPNLTNNPKDDDTWARNHPAAPEKSSDGSLKLHQYTQVPVSTLQADPILEDFGIPFPFPQRFPPEDEGYQREWEFVEATPADMGFEDERQSILLKAEELINGQRNRDYDHPLDNFQRICDMWSTILDTEVTPEQHALCMIAVKIARLMHSPQHYDSIVDIAGYAGTYEKVLDERARRDL